MAAGGRGFVELNPCGIGSASDSEAEELTEMDTRVAIYEPIRSRKTEAAIGWFAAWRRLPRPIMLLSHDRAIDKYWFIPILEVKTHICTLFKGRIWLFTIIVLQKR